MSYHSMDRDATAIQICKNLMSQALPCVGSLLVNFLMAVLDLHYVGKLNDIKVMSAFGIGMMICNMLGIHIYLGLNGALETLVPRVAGAAEKLKAT